MLPKAKFIYCIEPTESHATVLSALLKCFTNNFSVDKLALYNKDGVCNFSVSPGNSTENKISNKGINVPCSTLDTYLKKHNLTKVSILKLDIEGAEGEVIQSVGSEIGICDTVYVEVHNIDEKKMIEKMSSVNFSNTTGNRGLSYYFYNNAE
jgi:FkbM family methyltransferase